MNKSQGSPAFTYDRNDLVKLGKSLLLAAAAATIPILSDFFAGTDFGASTPIITATASVGINAARRWVMDYTGGYVPRR